MTVVGNALCCHQKMESFNSTAFTEFSSIQALRFISAAELKPNVVFQDPLQITHMCSNEISLASSLMLLPLCISAQKNVRFSFAFCQESLSRKVNRI